MLELNNLLRYIIACERPINGSDIKTIHNSLRKSIFQGVNIKYPNPNIFIPITTDVLPSRFLKIELPKKEKNVYDTVNKRKHRATSILERL